MPAPPDLIRVVARDESSRAAPLLVREPQPDYARGRCVCSNCGAHVACRIGLATAAGTCTVCGGMNVEPIDARRSVPDFTSQVSRQD